MADRFLCRKCRLRIATDLTIGYNSRNNLIFSLYLEYAKYLVVQLKVPMDMYLK
jgi:hypothetical protein